MHLQKRVFQQDRLHPRRERLVIQSIFWAGDFVKMSPIVQEIIFYNEVELFEETKEFCESFNSKNISKFDELKAERATALQL